MKDIQSIKNSYKQAKLSPTRANLTAYKEAVDNAFNTNPVGYVLQLEYIISSSIGVDTLIPFIEKYGLPVSLFEKTCAHLKDCKKKLEKENIDSTEYEKVESYIDNMMDKYGPCIAMNEYITNDFESIQDKYYEAYYGNINGNQGRMLIKGMYDTFGEASVMDSIITANEMGDNALNTTVTYFSKVNNDKRFCESLYYAINKFNVDSTLLESVYKNTNSYIANQVISRNKSILRESVITNNPDMCYEYSEEEIEALSDLLSFKEYCICCNELLDISINEYLESMGEIADELDGINEDCADLVSMLPQSKMSYGNEKFLDFNGHVWKNNSTDKKSGNAPGYLSANHDMVNYGEDEGKPQENNKDNGKSLDDYARTSSKKIDPIDYDDDDETSLKDKDNETSSKASTSNNYYYYTYTNSLNKNSNSFNKDNSSHDDHSTHTKSDDHSIHDDHSSNKRIKSNDYNYSNKNDSDEDPDNDNKPEEKTECAPWELTLFTPNYYSEADDGKPKSDDESSDENSEVGSADDDKPKSDHPIQDAIQDIDRNTKAGLQKVKKVGQNVVNTGKAIVKPINAVKDLVSKTITKWKDTDENSLKEKIADPHSRSTLYNVIRKLIIGGSLWKAGILQHPLFWVLGTAKLIGDKKKQDRLKHEIIGELKTEIEIIDKKIEDCNNDYNNPDSRAAKYKLMRLKNEMTKKLMRVAGGKNWYKQI